MKKITARVSAARVTPLPVGDSTMTRPTCVIVKTNTRSKNSSRVDTRAGTERALVTGTSWLPERRRRRAERSPGEKSVRAERSLRLRRVGSRSGGRGAPATANTAGRSVRDREPLPPMRRALQLVDERDRVVLRGDPLARRFVRGDVVGPGALAGFDQRRRGDVGPVQSGPGRTQELQRPEVRERRGPDDLREAGRLEQAHPGRGEQAA